MEICFIHSNCNLFWEKLQSTAYFFYSLYKLINKSQYKKLKTLNYI